MTNRQESITVPKKGMAGNTGISGLTILETLIVLLLMSVCFTVISQIVSDYSKTMRFVREKERAMFSIQTGLQQAANELREANEVIIPSATGSTTNKLSFYRRIPPESSTDYENETDKPDYGFYLKDPINSSPSQTIEYSAESGSLYRKTYDPSGKTTSKSIISGGINCLSVLKKDNHQYDIILTLEDNKSLQTIKTTVVIRGGI